jgi:hypothetical protein
MSAPLEAVFEARVSAEVKRLGRLGHNAADIDRLGQAIGRVAIEVYGEEIGNAMVGEKWQRDQAAAFTLQEMRREEREAKQGRDVGGFT